MSVKKYYEDLYKSLPAEIKEKGPDYYEHLGFDFSLGLYGERSIYEIMECYNYAIALGHARAAERLGAIYHYDKQFKDLKHALKLYKYSKKLGNPYAQKMIDIVKKEIAEEKRKEDEEGIISFSTFRKRLKDIKSYDAKEEKLDKLWWGDFESLHLDSQNIDISDMEMSYDNVDLLYTLSHAYFMLGDNKLCRHYFEELYNKCFTDFNYFTDEELNYIYENHGCHYGDINPTRDDIIRLLKSSYRHYFVTFEIKLLTIYADSSDPEILEIYKLCSKSQDEEIRSICCAKIRDVNVFENDPSDRVKKIVALRTGIDEKISELSDSERRLIDYIIDMYKHRKILVCDGLSNSNPEKITANIKGPVFKNKWFVGDRDIYWHMRGTKVFAYDILQRIKKGELLFKEGMEPDFFDELGEEYHHTSDNQISQQIK